MSKKTITFGIPCYNSADYMDHCIESILEGTGYADDVQIVIVDDGSAKDNTPAKADEWASRHPEIIKTVHQENGGHGIAVMKAVEHADGAYFKNIDSDDWVDGPAVMKLLETLRGFIADENPVDLVITNYVYEHVEGNTQNAVDYRHVLPVGKVFTWAQMGHFMPWQYLLMHAITYRTETLRAAHLPMPKHTFYVDNIYAYVPLPNCKTLYYADIDLYRYFIGREGQSVNEATMVKRLDQQYRVTRIMMEAYHLYDDVEQSKLRSYMMGYFTLMMAVCAIFTKLSDKPGIEDELDALWNDLKAYDKKMYSKARHGVIGLATNLPTKLGEKTTLGIYHIASKLFKFN